MSILVFVTDDASERGTGPILFLAEARDAILPENPRSLPWRYVATSSLNDGLLDAEEKAGIEAHGYHIANRLLFAERFAKLVPATPA